MCHFANYAHHKTLYMYLAYSYIDGQIDRQIDRQTGRQINRQIDRYSGIGNSCPFCTYTFFNASSLAESHLSVCQVALAKIGSRRNQNLSVSMTQGKLTLDTDRQGQPSFLQTHLNKEQAKSVVCCHFCIQRKKSIIQLTSVGFTPITCSVGFPQFKQFCNQSSASPLTQTCPTLHFLNAYTVVSIGCTPYTSTMNTTFLLITLVQLRLHWCLTRSEIHKSQTIKVCAQSNFWLVLTRKVKCQFAVTKNIKNPTFCHIALCSLCILFLEE